VPLNTARTCYTAFPFDSKSHCVFLVVLAVQNMNACNAVGKDHEIEFKALESSLNMMSKGKFELILPNIILTASVVR
jgi:hypothetical protein